MIWTRKRLQQEVSKQIQELFPDLREMVSREIQARNTVVGIEQKQIFIGGGSEYTILDYEAQEAEWVDAVFDLHTMKEGDALEIDVYIRWPWGQGRYLHHRAEGRQDDPALRVTHGLLCPAGARIVLKHSTGIEKEIGYSIVRRSGG